MNALKKTLAFSRGMLYADYSKQIHPRRAGSIGLSVMATKGSVGARCRFFSLSFPSRRTDAIRLKKKGWKIL